MTESALLSSRELALLALLNECGDDYGRAHDLSMAMGNPRGALYAVAIKMTPEDQIAAGDFPLLLSPSDFDAIALDTTDDAPRWSKLDNAKMMEILRSRGLPDEYAAMLERDRLASIDAAAAASVCH